MLHAKLNPPVGFRPYGATQGYAPSGEVVDSLPVHWFSELGWGPAPDNDGFGHYAFRQVGERQAEYAFYKEGSKDVMDGRGDLVIGPDGYLYITGNESDADKFTSAYRVPGYVPIVDVGTGGSADTAALYSRVAALELRLSQLAIGATTDPRVDGLTSRVTNVEAVAAKANERGWNALTQLVDVWAALKTRIGRDDAWQLAADRCYVEVTTEGTGVRSAIKALIVAGSTVDQPARDLANLATRRAADAEQLAALARSDVTATSARLLTAEDAINSLRGSVVFLEQATLSVSTVVSLARQAVDEWFAASVAYTDKRLKNLLWDRAVRLLRYKESKGLRADQLPVNDQSELV